MHGPSSGGTNMVFHVGSSSSKANDQRSPSMNRKRETLPDIVRRIPVNSLRPLLKCSLVVAAEELDISPTTLKRLCRHYGIQRWPHRQIAGIERTLSRLQAELAATAREKGSSKDLLSALSAHIEELNLQREAVIELALQGGHEPVRAKLAAVGVFVNAVQVFRETRNKSPSCPSSAAVIDESAAAVKPRQLNATPLLTAADHPDNRSRGVQRTPARPLNFAYSETTPTSTKRGASPSCASPPGGSGRCSRGENTSPRLPVGESRGTPKAEVVQAVNNSSKRVLPSTRAAKIKLEAGKRRRLSTSCSANTDCIDRAKMPDNTMGCVQRNQVNMVFPWMEEDVKIHVPRPNPPTVCVPSSRAVTPLPTFVDDSTVPLPQHASDRWGGQQLNKVPPRPLTPAPLPAVQFQSDHRIIGTTCDSGAKTEVPFDGDMTYDDFCLLGKMAFGPPDGTLY